MEDKYTGTLRLRPVVPGPTAIALFSVGFSRRDGRRRFAALRYWMRFVEVDVSGRAAFTADFVGRSRPLTIGCHGFVRCNNDALADALLPR